MSLHIGDYQKDTGHLDAALHGAYLLLIMHYWTMGGLPDDDAQLARIARMTRRAWNRARPTIQAFFHDGWKHGRIDAELCTAEENYARRAEAGKKGGTAKKQEKTTEPPKQCSSNAQAMQKQPLTYQERKDSEAIASATDGGGTPPPDVVGEEPKAKLFRVGKTILVSFGIAERRTGALIGQWLKTKNDPVGLLAAIQFAREHNVAEPVAYISACLGGGKGNGNGRRKHLSELAFELADEWREREREREHQAGIRRPFDDGRSH